MSGGARNQKGPNEKQSVTCDREVSSGDVLLLLLSLTSLFRDLTNKQFFTERLFMRSSVVSKKSLGVVRNQLIFAGPSAPCPASAERGPSRRESDGRAPVLTGLTARRSQQATNRPRKRATTRTNKRVACFMGKDKVPSWAGRWVREAGPWEPGLRPGKPCTRSERPRRAGAEGSLSGGGAGGRAGVGAGLGRERAEVGNAIAPDSRFLLCKIRVNHAGNWREG